MTAKKMTIAELRTRISAALVHEGVDFWNQEYHYDPRRDTPDELLRGALKWYGFAKSSMHLESPADPAFLKKLRERMQYHGISDDVIDQVIFKVRLHKASSAEYRPVTMTNMKPVR